MTVESALTKKLYRGNGAATEFAVPFPAPSVANIVVMLTDAQGRDTVVPVAKYRVNKQENGKLSVTYPLSGDPLPVGGKLTIFRSVPRTQVVDLTNAGAFHPDDLEISGLDRIVMMVQEIQEEVDRSIKVSISAEGKVPTAEDLYAEMNLIADRAEDAVTRSELAADKAETAADIAQAAAELAMEKNHEIMNLSIAVDDAPYGHQASGSYNPETGMLTFLVPEGKQGVQGVQGAAGSHGAQGPQGNKGDKGDRGEKGDTGVQGPAGAAPYADCIDCGGAVLTQLTTIDAGTAASFM